MKLVNNYDQINYVLLCLVLAVLVFIFVAVRLFFRVRYVKSIVRNQSKALSNFLEQDRIRTEKTIFLITDLIKDVQFNQKQMISFALILKNELGIIYEVEKSPDAENNSDSTSVKRTLIENVRFNQSQIERFALILKTKLNIDVDIDKLPGAESNAVENI